MTISIKDHLPDSTVQQRLDGEISNFTLAEWSKGRKVVLFAVPGAFTPTCSAKHLPGFVEHAAAIKAKGVDAIGCLSVNDVYVMEAWGQANQAEGVIDMLADPEAVAAEAMGLAVVKTPVLGNMRAARMALIAEDGVVTHMFMEDPGAYEVSSASHVLNHL
ncbi:MAG: peroxiredoxin [Alphaproteobacteria bacterium]|nr:peroxiredoxin [Alphaproteobacteria bacterium]